MKRLGFLTVVFLISCGRSDQKKASITLKDGKMEAAGDTSIFRNMSAGDTCSGPLLMIARGAEPGWYAEFHSNRIFLVSDYGKDTFERKGISFVGIDTQERFETESKSEFSGKLAAQNYYLKVVVKSEKCVEAGSGETRDHSITIQLDKKILSGCAASN